MSRANQWHLIKEPAPPEVWCGYGFVGRRLTEDPLDRRLCPDCSRAYWADRLAREPGGYTISKKGLTEDERTAAGSRWAFRAMFPITGPAGHVGFIALRNGFGKGYTLSPWRVVNGEEATASGELRYIDGLPKDYDGGATFTSKEQALFHVPMLVEKGALADKEAVERDHAQQRQERIEKRRQQAIRDEEAKVAGEQRHQEYLRQTSLISEAFAELLARNDVTNFQREGLILAAKRLNLKLQGEAHGG